MSPELRAAIEAAGGTMPLEDAMALAVRAYYARREPFGAAGDFVTAPEVSQMFGEMLGLWAADLWLRAGAPAPLMLAELGPGRGTMMADALRAIGQAAPAMAAAIRLHLVETSPRLRSEQARRLPGATWHEDIRTLPNDAPLLILANEFLDALPIVQFERRQGGWTRRAVSVAGTRAYLPATDAELPEAVRDWPAGAVFECRPAADRLAADLAERLARQGGAALFLDYGHAGPLPGDTLQALFRGVPADPLTTLGEADLSAHVDFAAFLAAAAGASPVATFGPVPQGAFLSRLGIAARADALKTGRSPETRAAIEAALSRLTASAMMGRLFKAAAIVAPGWPEPAGFDRKAA
jgi:NADH dehydrogenase [ubiquinone] 1 alpha subcomplex assembly factor 7